MKMKKFLKIEELKEKDLQEFQSTLTENINNYKSEIDKINKLDELNAEIENVDKLLKEDKEYVDSVIYKLPEEVMFNDELYKNTKVFNDIIYFLNRNEVEWNYTLGLYQLVDLWKKSPKEISYGAYDSTLRMLQQNKFKGFEEWKNILVINNFMSSCHESYTRDTNWIMYHNALMNILLDREKLINPTNNDGVDDNDVVRQDMEKTEKEKVNKVLNNK